MSYPLILSFQKAILSKKDQGMTKIPLCQGNFINAINAIAPKENLTLEH